MTGFVLQRKTSIGNRDDAACKAKNICHLALHFQEKLAHPSWIFKGLYAEITNLLDPLDPLYLIESLRVKDNHLDRSSVV